MSRGLFDAAVQIRSTPAISDRIFSQVSGSPNPFAWTAATVQEIVRGGGIVNVLYNSIATLVADGVTDNLSAINTIIAAVSPGTIIYFPAGAYFFSGKISTSKMLYWKGEGFDQSLLMITANTTLLEITGSTADGSRLRDLGFVGNGTGTSQHGFVGTGTLGRYYVEFCKSINMGGDGFRLSGNATSPYHNTYISHCFSNGNTGIGIRTVGQYMTVLNCSSTGNTGQDLQAENANCKYLGGSYQKIRIVANTDNGKLQFYGLSCNHGVVAIDGHVFADGSNAPNGIISPIEWKAEAAASSFSIRRCKNLEINSYVPGLTITDLLAGSMVNIHDSTISGGLTISSLNATAQVSMHDTFFVTAAPSITWDDSGIIRQHDNWDSAGNSVTIS